MRSRSSDIAFVLFTVSVLAACGPTVETSMGSETAPSSDSPRLPPPPSSQLPDPGVRLAQGMKPSCVKTAAGKVRCWSYAFDDPAVEGIVELAGIDDAVAVAQSIEHGCALHATGQLSCWGYSHKGQLGLAVPIGEQSDDPVLLPEVSLVKMTCGHHAVCGIEASGQAVCWGGEYDGPLGDPSVAQSQAPVDVVGVGDAIDIAAAINQVCAVRAAGTVACWRANEAPVAIAGVAHASQVAAGSSQACAIVDQGNVVCWHDGGAPAALPELDDAVQISASFDYACARRATGRVTCWRSTGERAEVDIDDAIDVAARDTPSGGCAVRASGDVVCWDQGQPPSPVP